MASSVDTWALQQLLANGTPAILLLIAAGAGWQRLRQMERDLSECIEMVDSHRDWIARAEGRLESERRAGQ